MLSRGITLDFRCVKPCRSQLLLVHAERNAWTRAATKIWALIQLMLTEKCGIAWESNANRGKCKSAVCSPKLITSVNGLARLEGTNGTSCWTDRRSRTVWVREKSNTTGRWLYSAVERGIRNLIAGVARPRLDQTGYNTSRTKLDYLMHSRCCA